MYLSGAASEVLTETGYEESAESLLKYSADVLCRAIAGPTLSYS